MRGGNKILLGVYMHSFKTRQYNVAVLLLLHLAILLFASACDNTFAHDVNDQTSRKLQGTVGATSIAVSRHGITNRRYKNGTGTSSILLAFPSYNI